MKGIKIVLIVFMSVVALLCVINTGFAQKTGKKEPIPQPPIQQVDKRITIIRDCNVPYIDTEKLYAVVETSIAPAEINQKETEIGENRDIGKGKSTTEKNQTIQQTYEYAISPEVEIRELTEKGLQFNIGTVAAVGFITKADIFVMKNEVVKIIILDMEQ